MDVTFGRRSRWIAIGVGATMALSAGIAYATGGGNDVIYACKLKSVGTVRLIQPGRSGLQGRCSSLETEVTWNQKGQPGAAGPKGNPGPAGPKGDTGATGAQGLKGDTGATGAQGLKGDTGATGAQGLKGDTGATGAQGLKGDTGATGAQGLKGDTGATGAKGATGATGATGPAGADGQAGLAGYQVVQTSAPAAPGITITGTQFCPNGKRMISGGWTTKGNETYPPLGAYITSSGPTADGSGWTGGVYNTPSSGETITVTIWTVCVTPPPGSAPAAARAADQVSELHAFKP
jgi:hypothetical protein